MSSEPKPTRDLATINQEYSQLCSKLGQLSYQIFILRRDSELINNEIRELNFEAAAANKVAAEAATPPAGAEKAGE